MSHSVPIMRSCQEAVLLSVAWSDGARRVCASVPLGRRELRRNQRCSPHMYHRIKVCRVRRLQSHLRPKGQVGIGFTYLAASSWRRLFARSTLGSSTVNGVLATIAARCSDIDLASSGTMGMMPSTLALLGKVRSVRTNDPSRVSRVLRICRPGSSSESISSPRRKRASSCSASASETVVRSLTSSSCASIRCCSDSSAAFRDRVGQRSGSAT